jgi:hypothetical protein
MELLDSPYGLESTLETLIRELESMNELCSLLDLGKKKLIIILEECVSAQVGILVNGRGMLQRAGSASANHAIRK